EEAAAVRGVLSRSGVPTTLGAIEVLTDSARRTALATATEAAVRGLFPRGIAATTPGRGGVSAVRVRGVVGGERLVTPDSIATADGFYREAALRLPAGAGPDAAELQRLLLVRYFQPSIAPNQRETEAARARARSAVDRVKARVLAGEKIVGAREQVGEREEERLRAYQAALAARQDAAGEGRAPLRALGSILYNLLLLGIVGFLLRFSREHLYESDRTIVFLGLITVAVAALAALIGRLELPPELIPVPFATMVIAVLWGGRLALAMALILALILGGQAPFLGVAVPFTAAVGGAAAAFGVRVAQRRLQTWMVVGIIATAYAATALSVGLLRAWTAEEIGWAALWGAVNATGSSLLAVGFLPVAEWFTRVTTNQTLQELSDPKQPLLKRLSLEAPGTYAHTISVANLAEAVCNAIGANALLARVGVYYHDVGKVVKPQYFIENQPKGRNPHDKLKPAMSAAIVRSHVAEGIKLAEQHRLPDAVKAFITEHHGTQPISFFLEQARKADPEARLNPADFSYGGPRPQTRETAVAMMADSVESAARVLQDPTPARIRELVDRIVNAKIAAGQLDQCPLTMREINTAKDVLARSLSSMYHHRVDYPAPPPPASGEADGAKADVPEPAQTGAAR
ncbi:MAG TPA: HDIG domain-containing protein, partial [Longimicrobium sp.]|nr:HDIG domain-containing protein [Longimicrobium sp.]